MIEDAEEKGLIQPGKVSISSGVPMICFGLIAKVTEHLRSFVFFLVGWMYGCDDRRSWLKSLAATPESGWLLLQRSGVTRLFL